MSKRVVGRDAGRGIHMKSTIVLFKYSLGSEEFYTPQFATLDEVNNFVKIVSKDNDLEKFEVIDRQESLFGFEAELGSLQIRCERICNPNPEDFIGKELFSSFPWTRVETLVKRVGVKKEKVIDNFEDFLKVVNRYNEAHKAGLEPIDEF